MGSKKRKDKIMFDPNKYRGFRDLIKPTSKARNLIRIDGDWYLATLPLKPIWEAVHGRVFFEKEMDFYLWEDIHIVLDYPSDSRDQLTRGYYNLDKSGILCNMTFQKINWMAKHIVTHEGQLLGNNPSVYGYRPMLIPLDSSLQFRQDLLAKDNPNGSILEGGTFYVGSQRYDPSNAVVLDMKKRDELCFCNTEIGVPPLKWVVWDGFLYATANLAHVPFREMFNKGWLFG